MAPVAAPSKLWVWCGERRDASNLMGAVATTVAMGRRRRRRRWGWSVTVKRIERGSLEAF